MISCPPYSTKQPQSVQFSLGFPQVGVSPLFQPKEERARTAIPKLGGVPPRGGAWDFQGGRRDFLRYRGQGGREASGRRIRLPPHDFRHLRYFDSICRRNRQILSVFLCKNLLKVKNFSALRAERHSHLLHFFALITPSLEV